MTIYPKLLLQLGGSFTVSVTAGSLFAVPTSTLIGVWIQGALIIFSILALSSISWLSYKILMRQKRFVLQGEEIENYEACGFGEKDDPLDESGKILVNLRPQWNLVGSLESLGAQGFYLANIRYKRLKEMDGGRIEFKLRTAGKIIAKNPIDLDQVPLDRFVYTDIIFEHDGKSKVEFLLEPNDQAKVKEILGFDRLEAYFLPKAKIVR